MRTTHRRQPRAAALAVVMIVAGLGGLFVGGGTASADVDAVSATGFGISVALGGNFVIPPTPNPNVNPPLLVANESSTDFGPHTAAVLNVGGVLGILENGVSVGPVSTQASNIVGENHFGSVAATAQVADVSILSNSIDIPLIVSSCISNGEGSIGTTTVTNARIGPNVLLNGPIAPNTTIDVLGIATVVLNEQIISNTPPSGGNPGATSIIVNAAHIRIPADGSVADIILAQSRCAALGPDVLQATTTSTTRATTTTTSGVGPATTTTTTGVTSSSSSSTSSSTSSTIAATTSSTTPTATTASTQPPTVSGTVATIVTIPPVVAGTVLARTGSALQPLAVMSIVSIVLGILLLVGSERPLVAARGGAGYVPLDGAPEKWGPVEIAKTIWAGFATLLIGLVRLFGLRRLRR